MLAGLAGPGLGDLGGMDPRLERAAEAVAGQRRVRFGYRTARGAESEREVDAYGLTIRGGHWYLVGRDEGRGEIRSFRLSRFSTDPVDAGEGSAPPEGFRVAEHVQAGPWGPGEPETTRDGRVRARRRLVGHARRRRRRDRRDPRGRLGRGPRAVAARREPGLVGAVLRSRRRGGGSRRSFGPRSSHGWRPPVPRSDPARKAPPKASERLRRLLAAVPYLVRHPGTPVAEAARLFGMSEPELYADLNLLFVSGPPAVRSGRPGRRGHPGRPDLDRDGRLLRAAAPADPFARRLPSTCAAPPRPEPPGSAEASALTSALAKLAEGLGSETLGALPGRVVAAGAGCAASSRSPSSGGPRRPGSGCGSSTTRRPPPRSTSRTVDPEEVFSALGHWYVAAWDVGADAERLFRADRIRSAGADGGALRASGPGRRGPGPVHPAESRTSP